MKKTRYLLSIFAILFSGLTVLHAQKVHTIGDSTMANYDPLDG